MGRWYLLIFVTAAPRASQGYLPSLLKATPGDRNVQLSCEKTPGSVSSPLDEQGQVQEGGEEKGQGSGTNRRLWNTRDLMDALVASERADPMLEVYAEGGQDVMDKLVSPLVTYARRYKQPYTAKEKRKAAQAEAGQSPFVFTEFGDFDEDSLVHEQLLRAPSRNRATWDDTYEEYDELGEVRDGIPFVDDGPSFDRRSVTAQRRSNAREDPSDWTLGKVSDAKRDQPKQRRSKRKKAPTVIEVQVLDQIISAANMTAGEAVTVVEDFGKSELKRSQKIAARFEDPQSWMRDRLEGEEGERVRARGEEWKSKEMVEARRQKALRAWKTRRKKNQKGNEE